MEGSPWPVVKRTVSDLAGMDRRCMADAQALSSKSPAGTTMRRRSAEKTMEFSPAPARTSRPAALGSQRGSTNSHVTPAPAEERDAASTMRRRRDAGRNAGESRLMHADMRTGDGIPESISRVRAEMEAARTEPGHSTMKSRRNARSERSVAAASASAIENTDEILRHILPSQAMRRMANALDAANSANAATANAATVAPNEKNPSAASAICATMGASTNFILAAGFHAISAR